MAYSQSETYSYTVADIKTVVRRFAADLIMIAQSSGAITEAAARDYGHDVEDFATRGYLAQVDITLFSGSIEVRAVQYRVHTDATDLTMSRPGGVIWPRVTNPRLEIVVTNTATYDAAAREAMRGLLRMVWTPAEVDTSHPTLLRSGGRNYASNGWGMPRTDFTA